MNQGSTTSRPLIWEDEAPAESRFRRVQQPMPRSGRTLPGMPVEIEDADDGPRTSRSAFGTAARGSWWRPASSAGRVFLGLGALIVFGGLGTASYELKSYMERDARFRIAGASQIEATGLNEVSRADLLPVFGEDIGRNIFFVPIGQRRKDLEALPWVERATVMRLLPDQIRVNVVERQPVAFTRHGQQIGLVDASGVLLEMPAASMAAHHYSFPVVTGLDAGDSSASRKVRMAVYGRLMAELDANNQRFSQQVSEIDLTDPEDARVLMPEPGADILAHFGEDHFLERYQRYKARIGEWRQQYPGLTAVDLRYEHQVVLEMGSGAAQPAAASADAATGEVVAASGGAKADLGKTDSGKVQEKTEGRGGAVPAKTASDKSAAVKTAPNKIASGKVSSAKSAREVSAKGKPGTKPAGNISAKAKTVGKNKASQNKAAQNKSAQVKAGQSKAAQAKTVQSKQAKAAQEKKRAQVQSVALKTNSGKPTKRPTAQEGQ